MLNKRVIENFSEEITSITNGIITPGNELVMEINKLFTTYHSQCTKVLITTAKDNVKGEELPPYVSSKIKRFNPTQTNGLPRNLNDTTPIKLLGCKQSGKLTYA